MVSGIFLPFRDLTAFSPDFQAEFADYVQAQISITVDDAEELAEPNEMEDGDEPADLSVAQARKFLERVSDKVRATIRVIAEADPAGFDMSAVMTALDTEESGSLRGVWGGITKRVRTVLGDDEAYLIWWVEQDRGWVGRVSTMTHRSLRKVLGL